MNLTLLDPVDRSAGFNRSNILARRAQQSFRLDTYRTFGKFTTGALLLAEGRRYDDPGNTSELDGYAKVDLRAEYQINSHWRLQGRVENIFDKQYETAAFFNQPGRNFFATLRYQP
jgi:vitamin B12 transporter